MLRIFALCAVFLAARGLSPGAYSFTSPSQRLVVAKQRSRLLTQHSGHPQGIAHVRKNIPSSEGATASRSRRDQAQRLHGGVQGAGVVLDETPGADGTATAAAGTVGGEIQPQETALATTAKTFVACAVLACSFLFASWPLREVPPCYALDAAAVAPSQQQQIRLLLPPRPQKRDRPPPPEIPPGRITIAQWVSRNIGPRLPRIDVQTAAEMVEKIRVNSGPAPTAEELRRMTGDAAKREWDGSFAGVLAGRGGKKEAAAVGGRGGDTAELSASRSKAEATPEEPSVPPPQFTRQQQIDALKVELLQLQTASPEATTSRPSSEASPPERITPNKLPPLPRVTAGRPSPLKMGMGFFPRTESVPAQARATRERPPPRKEKKSTTRRVASLAVDLKEELRAESERAAEKASQRAVREKNAAPRVARVQGTSVGGIELVPPAPLYSPPEQVATESASRAPLFTAPTGGSGAGAESGDLSSEPIGLGGGTAAARALLEGVGFGRVPEPLDIAEQVMDLAQKGAQASDDGVAAVIEQGRASVDRLQAEASRISAGVSESAGPIADNLAAGVAKLPEAGRATSGRLSEFSGSVAGKLSDSAKDATTGVADLGATTVGRLSGALERGAGKVLPSVGEAGRAVSDGVSAFTKNAADGLPAVQDQASALSSQVLDTSTRAASQATDIISAGAGRLSGRLSNLAGRGPEFAGRAKKALDGLTSDAGGFTDGAIAATKRLVSAVRGISGRSSSDGETDEVIYTVAAGAVAVAGAAAVARGIGVGATEKDVGAGSSGSAGAGVTHDEERVLQPIGVREETGASSEGGGRFGAEAVSATGTLWDVIRESGTGAGDAVREVSEEDLLARAAIVGGQLRETAEGLEVLKEEVLSLRESIRESDLDGKALRERLASILEGSVTD